MRWTTMWINCVLIGLTWTSALALTWDFDVGGDTGGWLVGVGALSGSAMGGGNSRARLRTEDGFLKVRAIHRPDGAPSASLCSPRIYADAGLFNRLRFRMKTIYDYPVVGTMLVHWTTSEGPQDPLDGRFAMVVRQVFLNEWDEIEVAGFADDPSKVWEGELLNIYIEMILSPPTYPPITEGPEEVWIDWITLTGPGEEVTGEIQPTPPWDRSGGVFGSYAFYPVGGEPATVRASDLDRDGDVDLILGCMRTIQSLVLLFNDGLGHFEETASYSFGDEDPKSATAPRLYAADMDGDGDVDLVAYRMGMGSTLTVWWNNGEGRFEARSDVEGYWPIGVSDFDGDGRTDVLVLSLSDAEAGMFALKVLRYADGTFVEKVGEQRPEWRPFEAKDFDQDGDVDVLWNPREGTGQTGYLLTLNDGHGHLDEGVRIATTIPGTAIQEIVDLDGDGDVDLIRVLRWDVRASPLLGVVLMRNRGDGDVVDEVLCGPGVKVSLVDWVNDLNGDDQPDLVVCELEQALILVWLGQLDGSFKEEGAYAVSGSPRDIAQADFDGDKDLDLAVADDVSGGVSILFNQVRQRVTEVEMDDCVMRPSICTLGKSYPNPFNAWTVIPLELAFLGRVRLVVYDILGRKVKTLLDEPRSRGRWSVRWDGRDALGRAVGSGVYVVRMETGDVVDSQRIILLR